MVKQPLFVSKASWKSISSKKNTKSFRPKDRPHGGRRRSRPCGRVPPATLGWGEKGHVRKDEDYENIPGCWQRCGRAATAVSLVWEECDRQTSCRSWEASELVCAEVHGVSTKPGFTPSAAVCGHNQFTLQGENKNISQLLEIRNGIENLKKRAWCATV